MSAVGVRADIFGTESGHQISGRELPFFMSAIGDTADIAYCTGR